MTVITTPEALDTDAIRARDRSFRQAIDASSDRVGVRAIKSARDVSDLLDALTVSVAEHAALRANLSALAAGWDEEAGDYVPPLPPDTPWRLMVDHAAAVRALLAGAR